MFSPIVPPTNSFVTIFYDSDGFMSMPRFVVLCLLLCIIISWVGVQFFGMPFDGFMYLCSVEVAALGAYGWKKKVEKGDYGNDK